MNHAYHLIWNAAISAWQVASELAKGRGKSAGPRGMRRARLVVLPLAALAAQTAFANLPTGGNIVLGSGSIDQSGATMIVTQDTAKMAADWQSFSIGQGYTVNFVQPDSSSIALNRVVGSDVSVIQGALNANGNLFLINQNGVLFTSTAQVEVGGIVASTLGMSNDDFANGNYRFEGASSNAVINQGSIIAANGGSIALIAAKIVNEGSLAAEGGKVLLGAGSKVVLDLGGPIKLEVEQGAIDALIEQGGAIRADGGTVLLTAKAANELMATVINHTGITEARTLATGEQGQILLLGGMDKERIHVAGTLDAGAPQGGNGGFIETSAAVVDIKDAANVSTLALDGFLTGTWLIDPTDIEIVSGGTACTAAGPGANCQNTSSASSIGATTLGSWLNKNNVVIETAAAGTDAGNITVKAAVSWTSNNDLTLKSHNNIDIQAAITSTGNQNSDLVLWSMGSGNITQSGTGIITMPGKLTVKTDGNVSLNLNNKITGDVSIEGKGADTVAGNVQLKNAMELNIAGIKASGTVALTTVATSGSTTANDLNVKGNISTTLASNVDAVVLVSENGNVLFLPTGGNSPSILVGSGSGWKIFSENLTATKSGNTVLSYPTASADDVEQWFGQTRTAFDGDSENTEGSLYRVYYRADSPEVTLSGMDGVTWVYGGSLTKKMVDDLDLTATAASGSGLSTKTLERIAREAKNYLALGDFSSANSEADQALFDEGLILSGDFGKWGWSLTQATTNKGIAIKLDSAYGASCAGSACINITPLQLVFGTTTQNQGNASNSGFQIYDKFYDGTDMAYLKDVGLTGLLEKDASGVTVKEGTYRVDARFLSYDDNGKLYGSGWGDASSQGSYNNMINTAWSNGDIPPGAFVPGGATGAAVADQKLVGIIVSGELEGARSRNYTVKNDVTWDKASVFGMDVEFSVDDVTRIYGDYSYADYGYSYRYGCNTDACNARGVGAINNGNGNLWTNGLTMQEGESKEQFVDRIAYSYGKMVINANASDPAIEDLANALVTDVQVFDITKNSFSLKNFNTYGAGRNGLPTPESDADSTFYRVNWGSNANPNTAFDTPDAYQNEIKLNVSWNDPYFASQHPAASSDLYADLTILPRPLQVAAYSYAKMQGDPDPALFEYLLGPRGLVNGDSLPGSLERDPGEEVGSYPVRRGSLGDNGDYMITFYEGTLVIVPTPPQLNVFAPPVEQFVNINLAALPPAAEEPGVGGLVYEPISDQGTNDGGNANSTDGPQNFAANDSDKSMGGPTRVFVVDGGINTRGR